MSAPIITLEFNADLDKAAELMVKKGIKKIVVTRNQNIVGMLSPIDFVRTYKYIVEEAKKKAKVTEQAIVETRWD